MSEFVSIVAVVRVLHFEYRLLAVLCEEDLSVFVLDSLLSVGSDRDERVLSESEELVVCLLSFSEHLAALVVGKSEIFLLLVLEYLA